MADREAELIESANRQPQGSAPEGATAPSGNQVHDGLAQTASHPQHEPTKTWKKRNRSLLASLLLGSGFGVSVLVGLALILVLWNSNLNPWREEGGPASFAATKVSNLFEQDVLQIQEQLGEAKKKIEIAEAEQDALQKEKITLELEIKELEAKTKLE